MQLQGLQWILSGLQTWRSNGRCLHSAPPTSPSASSTAIPKPPQQPAGRSSSWKMKSETATEGSKRQQVSTAQSQGHLAARRGSTAPVTRQWHDDKDKQDERAWSQAAAPAAASDIQTSGLQLTGRTARARQTCVPCVRGRARGRPMDACNTVVPCF